MRFKWDEAYKLPSTKSLFCEHVQDEDLACFDLHTCWPLCSEHASSVPSSLSVMVLYLVQPFLGILSWQSNVWATVRKWLQIFNHKIINTWNFRIIVILRGYVAQCYMRLKHLLYNIPQLKTNKQTNKPHLEVLISFPNIFQPSLCHS